MQKAQRKNFTLVGLPSIIIEKSIKVPVGQIEVEAFFEESIDESKKHDYSYKHLVGPTDQNTQKYSTIKQNVFTGEKVRLFLVVKEGQDAGKKFAIKNGCMIIGRKGDCDITLNDLNVSRKHAKLDCQADIKSDIGLHFQCMLTDLNSTNGTFVNGEKIINRLLKVDDVIIFGKTKCVLKKY